MVIGITSFQAWKIGYFGVYKLVFAKLVSSFLAFAFVFFWTQYVVTKEKSNWAVEECEKYSLFSHRIFKEDEAKTLPKRPKCHTIRRDLSREH